MIQVENSFFYSGKNVAFDFKMMDPDRLKMNTVPKPCNAIYLA